MPKSGVEIVELFFNVCKFSNQIRGKALSIAARHNRTKVVSLLLRISSFDKDGPYIFCAMQKAVDNDNAEMVDLLRRYAELSDRLIGCLKDRARENNKLEALRALEGKLE